jgi:arylsulfatase A-like enzyme
LIDASDVLPTIAALGGAKLPDKVVYDGRSFASQLYGKSSDRPWRPWCFTQYHNIRVIRDQRFKLYSNGPFYDLSDDPQEKRNLTNAMDVFTDEEAQAGYMKLRGVLDSMPPNAKLPWEFKSISARALQAFEEKRGK